MRNPAFALRQEWAHYDDVMATAILFVLGIVNFALNHAVMACDHPVMRQMPPLIRSVNQRFSLVIEFGMLVAGMMLAAQGMVWGVIGYGLYSLINGASAWLILTGRV